PARGRGIYFCEYGACWSLARRSLSAHAKSLVAARSALVVEFCASLVARFTCQWYRAHRAGSFVEGTQPRSGLADWRRLRNRGRRRLHDRADCIDAGDLARETICPGGRNLISHGLTPICTDRTSDDPCLSVAAAPLLTLSPRIPSYPC